MQLLLVATSTAIGPQTENRPKKLISILRALHEYVNFVHDPEKQKDPRILLDLYAL